MKKRIQSYLLSSVENYSRVLNDPYIIEGIEKVVSISVKAFKEDKKILFCGNGGSASDAQHIAAELSGRFYVDRPPLYAEALHVNSSFMTAVANDFGFEQTYARMLEACGRKGDILVGISTSGNSNNVIKALKKAKDLGMWSVGFTGKGTSEMSSYCDIIIKVPSDDTPRIQEAHILIGHVICKLIEQEMFPNA